MNGGFLFYRTDLLEQAGEKPPQTFDDLVRAATKIRQAKSDTWGYTWQGKQYEGLVCDFLEVLVGHGGFWIDPDTNEVGLEKPEAIAALTWLKSTIRPWNISPTGVTTYTEEESRQIFHAGKAVFHRNWGYVWPLSQKDESPIKGKVWMTPMPAVPGAKHASTLGGEGFAVVKSSPHKDAAWKFVQFITDLPQVRRLNEKTGNQPALKAFYEQSEDPALKAIYQVMQATVPRPPMPQYAQASDILQRHVSAALTGRTTPEDALAGAAKETRLLLAR
jgi:multiple sugar transport system substrate-binding protein